MGSSIVRHLRQPFDDTISLPKSKGEFSMFFTKNRFFSNYSQRKQMSALQKPAKFFTSWHNQYCNPGEPCGKQEFSTFSTGFSTASAVKSVDKSGMNFVYTKISTGLHNSVEIQQINITPKNARLRKRGADMMSAPLQDQSKRIFAAKIRSSFSSDVLWASTWRMPSSPNPHAMSSCWPSRASLR